MPATSFPGQALPPALTLLLLTLAHPATHAAEDKTGVRLYYRMLGEQHGGAFPLKTRSILTIEGESRTRTTGMADSGFTEYPFMKRTVSYTFAENFMYFPRIASGLPVDPSGDNAGDILIPQVYAPEASVWGPSSTVFVQTFTATGRELVSATFLTPSAHGLYRAALLEGGPGGPQVGPSRSVPAGSLQWGWAHWNPGQAPLTPGRTYGLRLWREDGQPWTPFFHATGDAYPAGILHSAESPLPRSDMAVWIVEEQDDLTRALIPDANDHEGIPDTAEFRFVPRSANIRLISVKAAPVEVRCRVASLTVWSIDEPARRLAGPKTCVSCSHPGGAYEVHFLFAQDELPVTPGHAYRAELRWLPFEEGKPPTGEGEPIAMDLEARVYGEPHPGALPAIGNLKTHFPGQGDMRLAWEISFPAPVTVSLERLSPGDSVSVRVPPDQKELLLPRLWRGHDYRFSLEATGPTGLKWRTPDYQLRIPDGPHGPGPDAYYPEHPETVFVRIAPPRLTAQPTARDTLRFRAKVALANPGFEEGLQGWNARPAGILQASPEIESLSPALGQSMAGWSHRPGRDRTDVKEESFLTQTIATTPGHRYLLTARLHTSETGGGAGNARVRLLADPGGEQRFEQGRHGSQWFSTARQWRRFEHDWTAQGDRATVGFAYFRWRDIDHSSAFVDQVMVLDLGPIERHPRDGLPHPVQAPRVVLSGLRPEATDRVEAEAAAPAGFVITGLGARAAGDNITTLRIRIQPLLPDGTLGAAETILTGWEPDAGLEANIDLPEGFVATGFGARIAPEWDVKTLALWARPLHADGTMGDEQVFRAGSEPGQGLEKTVRLEPGRVLTSAGLRCSLNDVAGIRAHSARLTRTASGP